MVLTKLDGDARGGAALSIHHVTGQPIKFVGVGEGYDALEVFHPDRMVSRILGMGDVMTLLEKAESSIDKEKALALQKKVRSNSLTLEDFRDQMQQIRKMGPLDQILGMLPRMGPMKKIPKAAMDEKQLVRLEAIINSMTRQERSNHHVINGKRRKRIAPWQRDFCSGSQSTAAAVRADAEDDEVARPRSGKGSGRHESAHGRRSAPGVKNSRPDRRGRIQRGEFIVTNKVIQDGDEEKASLSASSSLTGKNVATGAVWKS